jgi:thiol oxidase
LGDARQSWRSCKGSQPNSRGYTCGLWLLFHSLAAHIEGDTAGVLWMTAVRCLLRDGATWL